MRSFLPLVSKQPLLLSCKSAGLHSLFMSKDYIISSWSRRSPWLSISSFQVTLILLHLILLTEVSNCCYYTKWDDDPPCLFLNSKQLAITSFFSIEWLFMCLLPSAWCVGCCMFLMQHDEEMRSSILCHRLSTISHYPAIS